MSALFLTLLSGQKAKTFVLAGMGATTTTPARSQNTTLARLFHQMAACYRYMGSEQRFRALAYETAARTIGELKEDVSVYAGDVKSLDQLRGIGESIAQKIMEYLKTGKIETFELLKKEVPQDLLQLMDITGMGPATVKTLHEQLKISNEQELVNAIESGRLKGLRGFGPKKIDNMLRGLKLYKESRARMLLSEALQLGNELLALLNGIKQIQKAELAGSLRRRKETIGDIDIICAARAKDSRKIVAQLVILPLVGRVLAKGDTKVSFLVKDSQTQVDIRIVKEAEYGAALLYFTGSKEHNVKLREWAKQKGLKLNEYGLFDAETDRHVAGRSEEEIYAYFGMQTIPPELREEKGEIEAATRHVIPSLVELGDIKGDLQMHSKWSDGSEDIETIANYILETFPQYEYIVLTDHSPSERIAHGLKPPDFKRQFREIDKLNRQLGRDFVKKGVEVDILADGHLDLPDKLLEEMDWVVASIHSGLAKDNTRRLLKACEHPLVHCIGHPSGRLLGKREAYPVDWKSLFAKCVATSTAIEINAQPERLDLKDDLVRQAIDCGVQLVISTDAHSLVQFHNMELGVAVARRGWCTKRDVLNTGSWKHIEAFKKTKQKRLQLVSL
ncbi:MAG TPA: DNA polymerase/3'-5' exonuclease PolX [Flavisolibacter sp.]|nr:DNA polymerase/3'-5' exonuclease PolX [Flavisolibacter sp.]